VPELELLRLDHASALLAFERENRAYFAASIPDRGDEYFAQFDQRHSDLLAEQDAGQGLATTAVRQIRALAVAEYGLTTLRAATTLDNNGSRAVLARTGFVPTGETLLGGRPGTSYSLSLS
jgi:ribosomal-protein-alanine N-acetyltransferase